jgi:hypothetical protein
VRCLLLLTLVACDPNPPHHAEGATGLLAETPACAVFVDEGFALVNLGEVASLEVDLPTWPGVWGRETAFYGEDEDGCHYLVGGIVARVQYGAAIDDGYRPLFVEGLDFTAQPGCDDACDPSCRAVAAASADRLDVWCLERE